MLLAFVGLGSKQIEWCRSDWYLRYFVAINCDEPSQREESASVVQWLDAKDSKVSKLLWNMVTLAALGKATAKFFGAPGLQSSKNDSYPLGVGEMSRSVARKVPLHFFGCCAFALQDPVNNSSIHIYMNPLMKTMLQGEPAKLCAKEQLGKHESLIFFRGGRFGGV